MHALSGSAIIANKLNFCDQITPENIKATLTIK